MHALIATCLARTYGEAANFDEKPARWPSAFLATMKDRTHRCRGILGTAATGLPRGGNVMICPVAFC